MVTMRLYLVNRKVELHPNLYLHNHSSTFETLYKLIFQVEALEFILSSSDKQCRIKVLNGCLLKMLEHFLYC